MRGAMSIRKCERFSLDTAAGIVARDHARKSRQTSSIALKSPSLNVSPHGTADCPCLFDISNADHASSTRSAASAGAMIARRTS